MKIVDLTHNIENGMMIYPGDPEISIKEGLTHQKDYCHVDRLHLNSHTGTHIDAPLHFLENGKAITDYPTEKFVLPGLVLDFTHCTEGMAITASMIEAQINKLVDNLNKEWESEKQVCNGMNVEKSEKQVCNTMNVQESESRAYSLAKDYNLENHALIIATGWYKYFGTEKYLHHPYISKDAAELMVKMGISIVAVDFLNVDQTLVEAWDAHPVLLGNGTLIVENLNNTMELLNTIKLRSGNSKVDNTFEIDDTFGVDDTFEINDTFGVNDTIYTFSFLPLKVTGTDGSPIRAIAIK